MSIQSHATTQFILEWRRGLPTNTNLPRTVQKSTKRKAFQCKNLHGMDGARYWRIHAHFIQHSLIVFRNARSFFGQLHSAIRLLIIVDLSHCVKMDYSFGSCTNFKHHYIVCHFILLTWRFPIKIHSKLGLLFLELHCYFMFVRASFAHCSAYKMDKTRLGKEIVILVS